MRLISKAISLPSNSNVKNSRDGVGRRNLNVAAERRLIVRNVVAISLVIFLVPLAGCLDELNERWSKIELTDHERILPHGDYYSGGPAVGYEQFEWELTHIPTEGESSNISWDVFLMNVTNFQIYSEWNGSLEETPRYFVNGSWLSMDGNGTKGPFNVDSSDGYYLVVQNAWGSNENDTLRFRIQLYGWK